MRKFVNKDEAVLQICIFLICFIPILVSAFMTTDGVGTALFGHPIQIVCLFRVTTGFFCPVCGMTRCFIYMSHLKFFKAVLISPPGVLLYLFCTFESIYRPLLFFQINILQRRFIRIFQVVFLSFIALLDWFRFLVQFIRK